MPTKLMKPRRHADDRGWFSETYSRRGLADVGLDREFVQDNHAYSRQRFVLRGLHFQAPPAAQTKLVRCVAGAIWDVAVDIRRGSPSYGRYVAAELTAENGWQLLVPRGFAHGYLTLRPDTEVQYKVDAYYAPETEGGLVWDDPDLALPWPLDGEPPVVAAKDIALPRFSGFESPFDFDGESMTPLDLTGA
jgi:dTDP-4-dehydrorhamnose 3,5-epimerase